MQKSQNATAQRGGSRVRKVSDLMLTDLVKLQDAEASSSERPTLLPLAAIEVAPRVFQWRLNNEDLQEDDELVRDLVGWITRTDDPKPLDPILVMNIGDRYFVIDGHHRLDAYHTAQWSGGVPVKYFDGDLQAARIEAIEANKKNKLRLSNEAKREAAWKLLVEMRTDAAAKYTQLRLSEITTVPLRTIKRMSSTLTKHGDEVSSLTWAEARRKDRDAEFEPDDEWKDKKATKLAKQLIKCGSLTKDPEITAMALAKVSRRLPGMLAREWPQAAAETIIEELRERGNKHEDLVQELEAMWEL